MTRWLTATIQGEGDGSVSLCADLAIASRGDAVEEARDNLRGALRLFSGAAPPDEVEARMLGNLLITQVEDES